MPVKLERDDEVDASFPMWRKDFRGRGTVGLAKEMGTEEPVLIFTPPSNVGDKPAARQIYRIRF